MSNSVIPVCLGLNESSVFFAQNDYKEATIKEMATHRPPKPIYSYQSSILDKVAKVAFDIFSVIIFPIGIYRAVHALAGKYIVLASSPKLLGQPQDVADRLRSKVNVEGEFKYKRFSVEVAGSVVDACMIINPKALENRRWVLFSGGNAELYEHNIANGNFKNPLLSDLNANGIIFNYPGVGSSSGYPNRRAMAKTYQALLTFLEDSEKGLGAKEIIGYGQSIGGGVQAEALLNHKLKQGVKYVFVKSRTFSTLSQVATSMANKTLGFLSKVFGWNISSVASSQKLKAPEIIMQSVSGEDYIDLSSQPDKIVYDHVIRAKDSLANKLLEKQGSFAGEKYFMGIPDKHNSTLQDRTPLVSKINEMMRSV